MKIERPDGILRIGIVGMGAIGFKVCLAVDRGDLEGAVLKAVWDMRPEALARHEELSSRPRVLPVSQMAGEIDLLFEATNAEAMADIVSEALQRGIDVLVMSTGGFALHPELLELARQTRRHLYLPSGALSGLDGILASNVGNLDRVILTTTKHPRSLAGAPYLTEKKINLEGLDGPKEIFRGTAANAIRGFPANVNISITLSLAGLGFHRTEMVIVADPGARRTVHEIKAEGAFGSLYTRTESSPDPENPRTSLMAVSSAIATLKKIAGAVKVGT
ncbi:MAG: DUF108 domain-containing protein [Deltaproteobacteria bacterium]|nr:DUF108 domain-containing protein [Deltaproteobacteria bacterium]